MSGDASIVFTKDLSIFIRTVSAFTPKLCLHFATFVSEIA